MLARLFSKRKSGLCFLRDYPWLWAIRDNWDSSHCFSVVTDGKRIQTLLGNRPGDGQSLYLKISRRTGESVIHVLERDAYCWARICQKYYRPKLDRVDAFALDEESFTGVYYLGWDLDKTIGNVATQADRDTLSFLL